MLVNNVGFFVFSGLEFYLQEKKVILTYVGIELITESIIIASDRRSEITICEIDSVRSRSY